MSSGNSPKEGSAGPVLRLVTRDGADTEATPTGNVAGEPDVQDDIVIERDEAGNTPPADEPTPVAKPVAAPTRERAELLRVIEALLFSATQPMSAQKLAEFLPPGEDPLPFLMELQSNYQGRGVNLVRVAGKWSFRTAADLGYLLKRETVEERRLSKAALETLAIIAYHQPVTRAEIEQIRGVSTSAGTLDILLDTTWIRPRGRRRAPGRPVTYGTTELFLEHFGLDNVGDLPGLSELRGAGLLSSQLPPDFSVPQPTDVASLMPDELPLEDDLDEDQADLDLDESDTDDEEGELEAMVAAGRGDTGDSAARNAAQSSEEARADGEDLRELPEADKPEPSSG
ncbi:MAG: SMC-Scp complex subunit ScpB [Alphaproteobacteria bacterium]|nr:SMC-Scp complex subunit ScpB [Alphaproteobacteria bacterium]